MGFCEHCEGQRFDRARILRILRAAAQKQRAGEPAAADQILEAAIQRIRKLDIPHLERLEDLVVDSDSVH